MRKTATNTGQRTVTIKNFSRITKIVQVSAMKVHFQIAERSLFYINPDIQHRRMTYLLERMIRKEKSPDTPDCESKYPGLPVQGIRTLSFMY